MKPSRALEKNRTEIRRIVEMHGAANPRIFGSTLHGLDTELSDLDILVDPIAGKTTLISLVRIQRDIEALTGVETDILTPMSLHETYRQAVLAEAASL